MRKWTKKIAGKLYQVLSTHKTKTAAKDRAQNLRKRGYYARVQPVPTDWTGNSKYLVFCRMTPNGKYLQKRKN